MQKKNETPHDNKARDEQANPIESDTPYSTLGKDINDCMAAPYFKAVKGKPKPELPDLDEILKTLQIETLKNAESAWGDSLALDLLPTAWAARHKEAIAAIQAHIDKARLEQMVAVLLSMGGEIEITASAIREADSRNFTISSQPTSRLDGGLVYKLARLKSDKEKDS